MAIIEFDLSALSQAPKGALDILVSRLESGADALARNPHPLSESDPSGLLEAALSERLGLSAKAALGRRALAPVEALLSAGWARVDLPPDLEAPRPPPLARACKKADLPLLTALLNFGAPPHWRPAGQFCSTPTGVCLARSWAEGAMALAERLGPADFLERGQGDEGFFEALFVTRDPAKWVERMPWAQELAKMWVERGGDPSARGAKGAPPLLRVARDGPWAMALAGLLELGAEPDGADEKGVTPLMAAARLGDLDAVETLLAAGANPAREDFRGESVLAWARQGQHQGGRSDGRRELIRRLSAVERSGKESVAMELETLRRDAALGRALRALWARGGQVSEGGQALGEKELVERRERPAPGVKPRGL